MRPTLGRVNDVETLAELEGILHGDAYRERLHVVNVATRNCGPCKMIEPTYRRYAKYYADAVFVRCVSDTNGQTKEIADLLEVGEVPHFGFFRDGECVWRYAGSSEKVLRLTIREFLREGEKGKPKSWKTPKTKR